MAKLTPKQQRFVDEYLIDLNATQAAIRAGYSPKTARQIAEQNLSKLDIQNAISQAQTERAERTRISADEVLKMWVDIAKTDYNELTAYRILPCDFCKLGDDKTIPDPECDSCQGKGEGQVAFSDTTRLSPQAKLVYQGVKVTKNGMEILTLDRMKALDNVARHLGMFTEKHEVTGKDGTPIAHTHSVTLDEILQARSKILDDY